MGFSFVLYSEHGTLRSVFAKKDINRSLARYLDVTAEFKFQSRHKSETQTMNTNYLSRSGAKIDEESDRTLKDKVEEYSIGDEVVAMIDVSETGGRCEEVVLEQIRKYLKTMRTVGTLKRYRRQSNAYLVSKGNLLHR